MSEHDIVTEWLQASYDDYDSAKYLFDRPNKKALETICYHCQQSAEKSLKAFLCANNITIPRTHDTGILYLRCAEINSTFSKFQRICEEFTIYATETRYPIRIEIDEATTERLLQQALDIYNFVVNLIKPLSEDKS
jgi:HEPN domain-containing protein